MSTIIPFFIIIFLPPSHDHFVVRHYSRTFRFAFFSTLARLLAIKLGNHDFVPPENLTRLMSMRGSSSRTAGAGAPGNEFVLCGDPAVSRSRYLVSEAFFLNEADLMLTDRFFL